MQKVDNNLIYKKLKEKIKMPKAFAQSIKDNNLSVDMGLELFRKNIIGLYIESKNALVNVIFFFFVYNH